MKYISLNNGAIILMYHSIADETSAAYIDPANHVPAHVFKEQMNFLSKHRKVISFDELVNYLQQGNSPPAGAVVITFDDGYLDNLSVAASILEKFRFPATLFLPTGYIDREETQWIDKVYCMFKFRSKSHLILDDEVATNYELDDPIQYRHAYKEYCNKLLMASAEKREYFLDEITNKLKPSVSPPRLTMNWDELRMLKNSYPLFTIGAHTVEHTDLTHVDARQAALEMAESARRIENEIGSTPRYFSFCYGRTSEALRLLAKKSGFMAACGGQGLPPVIKSPADLMRLPRVAAPSLMRRFGLKTSFLNTGLFRKLCR